MIYKEELKETGIFYIKMMNLFMNFILRTLQ